MKTEWDYTDLAQSYRKRPDYADEALDRLFEICSISTPAKVCDVGAGTAHLTVKLAKRGFSIDAVEPNDAMRKLGMEKTYELKQVSWFEGTGENTGRPSGEYDLVSFGSSFNVVDQIKALHECFRILKPEGWFVCCWNHRDLKDPLQQDIERIIRDSISDYKYGRRRENQTGIINESGLFGKVHRFEGHIVHKLKKRDIKDAWRSHATLHRQAGDCFPKIIERISTMIENLPENRISVPYTTVGWCAQIKR